MSRFTLVELMIVVAIVAILAAVAVPLLVDYQRRSRAAELPLVLDGLMTMAQIYASDNGGWPTLSCTDSTGSCPTGEPGKSLRPWTTEVNTMGFAPDGAVRGVYNFNSGGDGQGFQDLDEDGVFNMWVVVDQPVWYKCVVTPPSSNCW